MIKIFKIDNAESYENDKKNDEKNVSYFEKIINKEYSKIEKFIFLIQNDEFNKNLPNSFYFQSFFFIFHKKLRNWSEKGFQI